MQLNQRRNRNRGPRGPRLNLTVADPVRNGDEWILHASAQVERDGKAVTGEGGKFLFSVDGGKHQESLTNALGVAEAKLGVKDIGVHTVYAIETETEVFRNVTVTIVEEKRTPKKPPTKLHYNVVGREGNYEVIITAFNEDGVVISDALIKILDEKHDPKIEELTTDQVGAVKFARDLNNEKQRVIVVRSHGASCTIKLFGARSTS